VGTAATGAGGYVGERRSPTAVRRGWTWESGRLGAKTLREVLRAAGVEPAAQVDLTRFSEDDPADWTPDPGRVRLLASWTTRARPRGPRATVVALGRRVQRALTRAGIAHRALTHPAAREAIRRRERSRAHVAAVLGAGREGE
jgi:hypothetical protein